MALFTLPPLGNERSVICLHFPGVRPFGITPNLFVYSVTTSLSAKGSRILPVSLLSKVALNHLEMLRCREHVPPCSAQLDPIIEANAEAVLQSPECVISEWLIRVRAQPLLPQSDASQQRGGNSGNCCGDPPR